MEQTQRTFHWIGPFIGLALAACAPEPSPTLPPIGEPPPAQIKSGMTYHKDVAQILQLNCTGCHVQGGLAPFALSTYQEARDFAMPMAQAVQSRRMPPWMPAPGCQEFSHSRVLTQDQINTIYSWSNSGAPEGDPKDAPMISPVVPVALPWVDTTMDAGSDYTPSGKDQTDYRCFVLDPKLVGGRDLIGFDIVPGVRREVHHVLLYPADAAEAKALDDRSPGLGWSCFGGPGISKAAMVGGWVPGSPATQYPEGTGIPLAAGQALVMQIHYDNHGGGGWAPDRTVVKLQFSKEPVKKKAQMLSLRNGTFSVPPGAMGYQTSATLKAPADGVIHGLAPHAHTYAKRMYVSSADSCLVDIQRWDFSWQQIYFYKKGIPVKAGTQLTLTCVFDNPGTSPIRWGENTTDEMCLNYFYVTAP